MIEKKPLFKSNDEALQFYNKKIRKYCRKYSMSESELFNMSEHSSEGADEKSIIHSLFRSRFCCKKMQKWFVYIILAKSGKLYTGITTNIKRRFNEHLNKKGAKFFYHTKPIKVVYKEEFPDR